MARVTGILGAAVAALLLAGCGGSSPHPNGLPCDPQPHGQLCVTLVSSNGKVGDVIGYLAASGLPLTGKTWRLVVSTGGKSFDGPVRHGNPPRATFCRDASGNTVTTPTGCHDTLAAAYASFGDFPGLHLPLAAGTRVCISEQLQSGKSWRAKDPPTAACSTA
jgi:hypothetical protein